MVAAGRRNQAVVRRPTAMGTMRGDGALPLGIAAVVVVVWARTSAAVAC